MNAAEFKAENRRLDDEFHAAVALIDGDLRNAAYWKKMDELYIAYWEKARAVVRAYRIAA